MRNLIILLGVLLSIACGKNNNTSSNKTTGVCINSDTAVAKYAGGGGCFIPNAFTPNNDGVNDLFSPYIFNVTNYAFTVKDGATVLFSTTNPNAKWDGTFNNTLMPADVYTAEVNGSFPNNQAVNISMCFYLCNYTNSPCLSKPASLTPYIFTDMVDPVTGTPVYLTAETICP